MQRAEPGFTLQIFATDLDKDAIDKARQGVYPANIAADVSPERLRRFFHPGRARLPGEQGDPRDGDLRAAEPHHGPALHQAGHLVLPQPADLSAPELQKKLIPLFHYSLNPGGVLIPRQRGDHRGVSDLFAPLDGKTRLYRRLEPAVAADPRSSSLPRSLGAAERGRRARSRRDSASRRAEPPAAGRSSDRAALRARRPCSATTRATSSTSAAGRASTSSPPSARPT